MERGRSGFLFLPLLCCFKLHETEGETRRRWNLYRGGEGESKTTSWNEVLEVFVGKLGWRCHFCCNWIGKEQNSRPGHRSILRYQRIYITLYYKIIILLDINIYYFKRKKKQNYIFVRYHFSIVWLLK